VNRKQPRLYFYWGTDTTNQTWLNTIKVPHRVSTDHWEFLAKYRSTIRGAVVYDVNVPDTVNVATAIAQHARRRDLHCRSGEGASDECHRGPDWTICEWSGRVSMGLRQRLAADAEPYPDRYQPNQLRAGGKRAVDQIVRGDTFFQVLRATQKS
jgi:hypothetical protein